MGPAQLRIDALPDGRGWWVEVPIETGDTCVVEVEHDARLDNYSVKFYGELLDQSPEAITATIQMAVLAVASARKPALGGH